MALTAGTSLGRYEIQSPLGAGGMGEVYLARDPLLGRTVAIKLLPTAFAGDPDRLRRFEQEAQASAALNHPGILAVHDVGRVGEQPFIVMEYVHGETLAACLRRGRLPLRRALEIGVEIANALAAAHSARIAHRDLKPANIMLTSEGHVKVLDFGLAKFLLPETAAPTLDGTPKLETIAGQVFGTPGYMSPEQLFGDPIDERTDIFTLGIILFELVTGQRPFGAEILDVMRQPAATSPIRTARQADSAVPAQVSAVIGRAMERQPSDRFQSAAELEAELRQLLTELPLSAGGTSSWRQTALVAGEGRHLLKYALWLFALALAAGVAVSPLADRLRTATSRADRSERPVIAVLPFTNLIGDDSKAHLAVGAADALTTSLARLSSISVVSRSTMLGSTALTRELDEIARELGATMLLRGSVQQAGDSLRVSATLVNPDGRVLWSNYVDATTDNLFSMENQLAESLLASLRITVTDAERRDLARVPTKDSVALEAYWQGLTLLDRPDDADFEAALTHFNRATARDPNFSLAFAALGDAYRRRAVRTNDSVLMDKAMTAVTEALRLEPEQPEVRLSLAAVYRATGKSALAIDEVNKVLANHPDNDNAHRIYGELLAGAGRPKEALEQLRLAVSLRQYWLNHERLGLFFYRNGQIPEAIEEFTQVAKLKPNDAMPFQQLGAMYMANGDRVRARQNFEQSLKISANASSFANLGTIAFAERRYQDAARAYEQAVKLAPNLPAYRGNLGDGYQKLGRAADAKAAYLKAIELGEQALALNSSDVPTVSLLGMYYAKVGSAVEAERYADQAVRMNPTSPEVLYQRAVVLTLLGKRDKAMAQLTEAINKGYGVNLAVEDEDLASLRSLPAFQRLAAAAKSR